MLKYCGIAVCALAAVLVLKGQKSEFAGIVSFAAASLLFGSAVIQLYPAIAAVSESVEGTELGTYFTTLLKALGITLAVQFSSELCRDAGETSLASKLELIGKAEILLLCLPLIRTLLDFAREIVR